jgi:hypothetical protein
VNEFSIELEEASARAATQIARTADDEIEYWLRIAR